MSQKFPFKVFWVHSSCKSFQWPCIEVLLNRLLKKTSTPSLHCIILVCLTTFFALRHFLSFQQIYCIKSISLLLCFFLHFLWQGHRRAIVLNWNISTATSRASSQLITEKYFHYYFDDISKEGITRLTSAVRPESSFVGSSHPGCVSVLQL